MQKVVITGGTGYNGYRLIKSLDQGTFKIITLVRAGSEHKVSIGIELIVADVFKPECWSSKIPAQSIFINLLGASHPSPSKKKLFASIDFRSLKIVTDIASSTQAKKFIYLSVARKPNDLLKDFQRMKMMGEKYIKSLNLSAIFIIPWYVLRPDIGGPICYGLY